MIIAGNGVTAAGANAQLLQLAELLGAPVMLDRKSRDALPTAHPLVVPTSGYPLTPAMYELISTSDVALVIDGAASGRQPPARANCACLMTVLQIDREPSEIRSLFSRSRWASLLMRVSCFDGLLEELQDAPRDRLSRYRKKWRMSRSRWLGMCGRGTEGQAWLFWMRCARRYLRMG